MLGVERIDKRGKQKKYETDNEEKVTELNPALSVI
jgi:hypothetical protein